MKRVAAARAHRSALNREFRPANRANWNGRETRQGGAAKGAGGGEHGATQTIDWTSEHANHRTPPSRLRWRNVGFAKAGLPVEDTPRIGRRQERRPMRQVYSIAKLDFYRGLPRPEFGPLAVRAHRSPQRIATVEDARGPPARLGVRRRQPCRLPPDTGAPTSTRTRPAPPATA